jgi:hypothetical protein
MASLESGAYKEIHLSSFDGQRTKGDRNHPIYEFAEPIYLDKYMIKNAQVPITWWNLEKDQIFSVWINGDWTDSNSVTGAEPLAWPIFVPAGNWNPFVLLEYLTQKLADEDNEHLFNLGYTADYSETNIDESRLRNIWEAEPITISTPIFTYRGSDQQQIPDVDQVFSVLKDAFKDSFIEITALDFGVGLRKFRRTKYTSNRGEWEWENGAIELASLLGWAKAPPDQTSEPFYTSFEFYRPDEDHPFPSDLILPYPMKPLDSVFVYLRSSMASGNAYAASTNGVIGGFASNNILGKIPLDPADNPNNSMVTYLNPVGTDTMFNYNGGPIHHMDLYFTKENEEIPIDFKGFYFTITLGVWTNNLTSRR